MQYIIWNFLLKTKKEGWLRCKVDSQGDFQRKNSEKRKVAQFWHKNGTPMSMTMAHFLCIIGTVNKISCWKPCVSGSFSAFRR